mmetsp:Transcript_2423/g.6168  ORF Transcript_2423/g.6168 Transcript_2423/m.6168 type:complete len:103 (-) Transcript_2423:6-314(-)
MGGGRNQVQAQQARLDHADACKGSTHINVCAAPSNCAACVRHGRYGRWHEGGGEGGANTLACGMLLADDVKSLMAALAPQLTACDDIHSDKRANQLRVVMCV